MSDDSHSDISLLVNAVNRVLQCFERSASSSRAMAKSAVEMRDAPVSSAPSR